MNLAVDVGGVLEYFVRPRVAIGMDWGDLMLRFPDAINTGPFTPGAAARLVSRFQSSVGVSVQF